MKKIYTITALCLTLFSTTTFAQTPKETLAQGVEIYNAMREYNRTLTPSTTTDESIEDIKSRVERGIRLLDKVVKEGNADQIKAARYFKTNFQYELGFMHGMKGNSNAAYSVFKSIENSITSYKSSDFPMMYEYFDKNFKITWENFASTQAEYYTGMGEISYNTGEYDDAYTMTKNSLAHKNTTPWLSYIGVNKLLDIRTKKKSLVSDDEYYDFALKSMKTYTVLTKEEQQTVIDNSYPTWERGYKIFNSILKDNKGVVNTGNIIGEAGQILRGVNENEKAASFFKQALKNNWGTATILKNEVLPTAKAVKDNVLGLSVLERLVSSVNSTDCDNLEAFSNDFTLFGDATRAAEFKKKGETCRKQKEAEAKRAAEERKKQEEKAERERRKANRDNHFYLGVNVFPLFTKPADYGGVFNFGAKKTMIELSYLKVTKKKENYFDLQTRDIEDVQEHKWNGYFTHVAFKFSSKTLKNSMMPYSGILLGYGQRTFEPFTSNVTITAINKTTNKAFNPTNKQYIAMANFGALVLGGLGLDTYIGVGAAYNQFDGGNTEVWNKDGFTIEDKMVANRKPNYFSFMMRMGVSIGFGK